MARVEQVETHRTDYVEPDETPADKGMTIAERIISIAATVIVGLLALRFVLSLLGANRSNAFADFVYSASNPFAAPFFGLFNYTPQFGVGRFEYETIIAILFWLLVAAILMRVVTIGRSRE